jgi:acetyl-CoA carboxylase biotin carboxyl carrier protein
VSLTAKDIAEITRLLDESVFDELELEYDGLKIHLRRAGAAVPASNAVRSEAASSDVASSDTMRRPLRVSAAIDPDLTEVRAPLLGTFYRAPKPGAAPFVEAGATVEADSIIGIIEVMKLMNTVRAGVRGVVREICAQDGTLVEHGQTLLRIDTREPR